MFESDGLEADKYPHKVSAVFLSSPAAESAAQALVECAGLRHEQISVLEPCAAAMNQEAEPQGKSNARTLAKSRAIFGLGALPLGLLVAAFLVTTGPELSRANPMMTFIAMGCLFPVVGLFAAGSVSLRPVHDHVIEKTSAATEGGGWTVIAHCANSYDRARVQAVLGDSTKTL